MKARRIVLHPRTRAKLQRDAKRCKDADTRVRYRIVLLSDQRFSGKQIARALGCSTSTVTRTLSRFERYGQAGLIDRREDNGQVRADGRYARTVAWILASGPQAFFHRRPTWTKRVLIQTARTFTGVTVSRTTMGRVPVAASRHFRTRHDADLRVEYPHGLKALVKPATSNNRFQLFRRSSRLSIPPKPACPCWRI